MANLFFFGDSITAGAWDSQGGWVNRLSGEIMQKVIETQTQSQPFYCMPYNLGISGDTVPDLVRRIDNEIKARIYAAGANEPVEIIFAIGTNDSILTSDTLANHYSDTEFEDNLYGLVAKAKIYTSHISFLGLLPVDETLVKPLLWALDKSYMNESMQRFDGIIETFCTKENLRFLPRFDKWSAIAYQTYLSDGVHPNSAGHEKIADDVRDFLITDDFIQRFSS